jgi:hypothetical protein
MANQHTKFPQPLLFRFMNKVAFSLSGCWRWTARLNADGYGQLKLNRRTVRAHRVAYELFRGPLPEGKIGDHQCRNHWCVNPWHIEPSTTKDNVLSGVGITAQNARKTHCPQGHPYNEQNTRRDKKGFRYCRPCQKEAMRRWRAASH